MPVTLMALIAAAAVFGGAAPAGQTPAGGRAAPQTRAAPARGGINVDPAVVPAGMFYVGATVHVSAVVPADADIAMVCLGETHALTLKKKGKALGVIWMNVADVSFEQVPDLYLLRTSERLEGMAEPDVLKTLAVGYDGLEARAGPGPGAETLFGELTRLKQRDHLWDVAEGAVAVQPAGNEFALATTDFSLPAKAPPGVYRIVVYAFHDGEGGVVGESRVRVRQAGLAALISTLAVEHGLLYGVLAALIAVAVGRARGVVFGLGSKGGH